MRTTEHIFMKHASACARRQTGVNMAQIHRMAQHLAHGTRRPLQEICSAGPADAAPACVSYEAHRRFIAGDAVRRVMDLPCCKIPNAAHADGTSGRGAQTLYSHISRSSRLPSFIAPEAYASIKQVRSSMRSWSRAP